MLPSTQARAVPTATAGASTAAGASDSAQYLTFVLGKEIFAMGILAIKEIIEYQALTTVPMMPSCVSGVINLRGAVVPVLDLSQRFGRPSSDITKRTCIVIVEVQSGDERQVLGVVVDAVNEVLDISPADIEPAPAFGARIRTEFIHGMGKVHGKFVILLNVDHVLSLDEIGQLQGDAPQLAAEPARAALN